MFNIEIATYTEVAKEKGDALENFVGRLLKSQGYDVTPSTALVGAEIDLRARHHTQAGEILIECKARNDAVGASAINSLYTNTLINKCAEGWLITLNPIGRAARGKLEQISSTQEGRFKHILLSDLVQKHIDFKQISFPQMSDQRNELSLLIFAERDPLWVELVPSRKGGAAGLAGYRFDALASRIPQNELPDISTLKLPFSDYRWIDSELGEVIPAGPSSEDPVVRLVPGDNWKDFRPSNLSDFVGREHVISEIFTFLDLARKGETSKRTFGIKAPSGWGKSSIALKISHDLNNHLNKKLFFFQWIVDLSLPLISCSRRSALEWKKRKTQIL